MPNRNPLYILSLVACLALICCFGCGGPDDNGEPDGNGQRNGSGSSTDDAPGGPADDGSSEPAPAPKPVIPQVSLTKAQRATIRVDVGQAMPDVRIQDYSGQTYAFRDLYGKKLTVVFFWVGGSDMLSQFAAEDALVSLQKYVFEPYSAKGVQVVGINEGDSIEAAGDRMTAAGANFPIRPDANRAFFSQVAVDGVPPRIFLLDAEGTILWFDLAFTEITREKLLVAIQVALGEI